MAYLRPLELPPKSQKKIDSFLSWKTPLLHIHHNLIISYLKSNPINNQLWLMDGESLFWKNFFNFSILFAFLSIILYLRPYSCLFRSFFFSSSTLSRALLEFSIMLLIQVSATWWNFFTYSFNFLWFNWFLFRPGLCFCALLFWSKILRLSGSDNKAVIFFWRWMALRGCEVM